MKHFLALVLLAFATAAQAVDFEIGAGAAHYTPRGNMMWYQEGLPHKLDLNAPVYEAGLVDTAWSHGRWSLDWRATFVYVGSVHSDAIATYDDNYDKATQGCIGTCAALDRYMTTGHKTGIRLTLQPTYTYNGWRFGVESGVYIYRPTFHANVYTPETVINVSGTTRIQFAPVVGVSVGRGPWSVAYMHYFSKTLQDPYYAIWRATDTITLRYRF